MAIDWDSLYELAPSDTTYVKDTDDAIRSLKTATRERITKEHEFDLASQARQGLHRAGSAVAFYQTSAPTQRNGVDLAAADVGIEWIDSDTGILYVWDGDSWVSNVDATGAANTVALRDSNGDLLGRALESTVTTGTAPLRVASTTKVDNLNASLLANRQSVDVTESFPGFPFISYATVSSPTGTLGSMSLGEMRVIRVTSANTTSVVTLPSTAGRLYLVLAPKNINLEFAPSVCVPSDTFLLYPTGSSAYGAGLIIRVL